MALSRVPPGPVCPVPGAAQSLTAGGLLQSSCGWDTVAFNSSFIFVILHQLISCVKSWLIFKWSAKLSLQHLWSRDQSIFANLSLNGDTVCIIIILSYRYFLVTFISEFCISNLYVIFLNSFWTDLLE